MSTRPIAVGFLLLHLCIGSPAAGQDTGDEVSVFISRADDLIRDHAYAAATTGRFILQTDDPRLLVDPAAALLEEFHGFFDNFWTRRGLELRPREEPARIYLFWSRYKYRKIFDGPMENREISWVGHYHPIPDIVTIHTDTVPLAEFPGALVHESTHQLMQTRIYGSERSPSIWLGEGLASYFGRMKRTRRDGHDPSRIGGKDVSLFREVRPGRGIGETDLRGYRRRIKKDAAMPLSAIVSIRDPGSFYSAPGVNERYTASWLLVHFLLHGNGGKLGGRLAIYMTEEAAGRGGPDVFHEVIGMEPGRLQEAFREYVLRLKP